MMGVPGAGFLGHVKRHPPFGSASDSCLRRLFKDDDVIIVEEEDNDPSAPAA